MMSLVPLKILSDSQNKEIKNVSPLKGEQGDILYLHDDIKPITLAKYQELTDGTNNGDRNWYANSSIIMDMKKVIEESKYAQKLDELEQEQFVSNSFFSV